MRIGIVGSGHVGQALARHWARAGHQLYFSFSHSREKLEDLAAEYGENSKAVTPYDAVRCSEVVLFAPPWTEIDEALKQIGRFDGEIVIDATNPFIDEQMNTEQFEEGDSSSQAVERKLGDVRLVKAFNTLKADTLANKSGQGLVVLYAGNDPASKKTVAQLIEDAGFVPYDAGPLVEGKNQEPGTPVFLKETTLEQMQGGETSTRAVMGEIDLDQPIRRV
jgi:predicted dinucleotide-binding enzyme